VTRVAVWFNCLQYRIGTTRAAALIVSRLRVVSPQRSGWCHQNQRPRPRAGVAISARTLQKCTATASRTRLHPGGMVTGDLLADLSWRLIRHWRGRRDLDLAWFAQIEPRYRAARAAARDGLPQFNLDPVRLQSKERVPLPSNLSKRLFLGRFALCLPSDPRSRRCPGIGAKALSLRLRPGPRESCT
jgi:hypothetical protein